MLPSKGAWALALTVAAAHRKLGKVKALQQQHGGTKRACQNAVTTVITWPWPQCCSEASGVTMLGSEAARVGLV